MRILKLCATDPFANLAAERHLFERGDPEEEMLLLYVNDPCVVIGRSQNPLRECDAALLEGSGIPLLRRYTGGGTVYHDRGNLNFCFIRPRRCYDKQENSRLLLEALSVLGIGGEPTDRNDLVAGGRKFSGSAYRLTRDRALHHGTLLVSADLRLLRAVLKPSFRSIAGKGVLSVRSPVVALEEFVPGLTVPRVEEIIVRRLGAGRSESIGKEHEFYTRSRDEADAFRGRDWVWGRTPGFSITIETSVGQVRLEAAAGRVVAVDPPIVSGLLGLGIESLPSAALDNRHPSIY
jgi:lipoate---protein ligase